MNQRLLSYKAGTLVHIGRGILIRLEVNVRLSQAADFLRGVQGVLETRQRAWIEAQVVERDRKGERDQERRVLGATLREFGFIVLSGNGNHPREDPYLRYFPDGFGAVVQMRADCMLGFASAVLRMLEEETDARLIAYRAPIQAAFRQLRQAHDAFRDASYLRKEAMSVLLAEKRSWLRGMELTRALAVHACFYDRANLRGIFRPVTPVNRKVRRVEAAEEGENGGAEGNVEPGTVRASAGEAKVAEANTSEQNRPGQNAPEGHAQEQNAPDHTAPEHNPPESIAPEQDPQADESPNQSLFPVSASAESASPTTERSAPVAGDDSAPGVPTVREDVFGPDAAPAPAPSSTREFPRSSTAPWGHPGVRSFTRGTWNSHFPTSTRHA